MTQLTATTHDSLALLGRIARLLNTGLGPEDTLATVADALRLGLGADSVQLWLREPNATTPAGHRRPAAHGRARAPAVPSRYCRKSRPDTLRLPLLHEGERLGMLEVTPATLPAAAEVLLPIIADILAPFLASIELSEDLAYEVALRSREIEEQRRFITLVIDCLPVGLYVVDRDYRIQIWNRKRETGTQGLRRDEVVGRPVFEVLTRQTPVQLREEFDDVFEHRRTSSRWTSRSPPGGETKYYRISKIPMRLDGETITHVITIGEDVTEWHVAPAADPAEREARRHRPARRRASCTRSTIRSPPSAPASPRWRTGSPDDVPPAAQSRHARIPRDHRQGSPALRRASWTGCSTSAGPRARPRARST